MIEVRYTYNGGEDTQLRGDAMLLCVKDGPMGHITTKGSLDESTLASFFGMLATSRCENENMRRKAFEALGFALAEAVAELMVGDRPPEGYSAEEQEAFDRVVQEVLDAVVAVMEREETKEGNDHAYH